MITLPNNIKNHQTLSISQILTMLMKYHNLDDRSLSKATGIAHTNIARLRLNPKANPTTATVIPLARFFNITVGQLCGCEELYLDQQVSVQNITSSLIPIIEWDKIDNYLGDIVNTSYITSQFTLPIHNVSTRSFCLKVAENADELIMRKSSLVVVDPEKPYKHANIVLAKVLDKLHFIKIKIINSGLFFQYLNPISNEVHEFNPCIHQIIGVIAEIKYVF